MTKQKPGRAIVAIQTDLHGNHVLGLLNPDTVLYEEDEEGNLEPWKVHLRPSQKASWRYRTEDIAGVIELAHGDPIHVIDLGDQTQGGNGRPHELVSTRLADNILIGLANWEPWLVIPNVTSITMVKGTGYHELGEGSAAVLIADTVSKAWGHKVDVPYHAEWTICGVRFDLSHHGSPPGSRNWLKGNILRLYVQSYMDDCLKEGEEPADVLVRGHYHQYVPETITRQARGKTFRTKAAILPSYSFIDDFARKVARSPDRITIGMVAYEVEAGHVSEPIEFKRMLDFRTKKVLA